MNALPEDFTLYSEWEEYMAHITFPAWMGATRIGDRPQGLSRTLWPITLETYRSDTEPALTQPNDASPIRIIAWYRFLRSDTPAGWSASPLIRKALGFDDLRLEGFVRIESPEAITRRWSESQRRALRKYEAQAERFTLRSVASQEFWEILSRSDTARRIERSVAGRLYLSSVRRRLLRASRHVTCIVLADEGGHAAGMAWLDSPTHKASYYLIGFTYESGARSHCMTGLMREWLARSYEHGYELAHLGTFWRTGDPTEWKGFSLFKSKFGTQYVQLSAPLVQVRYRGRSFPQ